MAQNVYDDEGFFTAYSDLPRSRLGLDGAPEWPSLRDLLPEVSEQRVLDLGCGFGWFCRWASDAGASTVLGIDLSNRMLAKARSETRQANIEYRQADLDQLTLARGDFDLVFSSLTLHYLSDLDALVRRVADAMSPGAAFVFSVEHPIFTAPTTPGFVTDASDRAVWPLNGYLAEGARTTDWLAPGVIKHHRTVAGYVTTLMSAGLELTGLVEWGPSVEQIAATPEWAVERERPPFMLVSASKP